MPASAWPAQTNWPTGVAWPGGSPPPLTNMALWLDGTRTAYSDAGVTVASAPYGRVAQIAQPAPLSGNWTATGGNRPWRDVASLDFRSVTPTLLTQPASTAIPAQNCTIGVSWQSRGGQAFNAPLLTSATGHSFGLALSSGVLYLSCPAGVIQVTGIPSPLLVGGSMLAQCAMTVTCRPTQYEIWLSIAGNVFTSTMVTTPSTGNLGAITVGQTQPDCAAPSYMGLSQLVGYSAACSASDLAALQSFLLRNPSTNPPTSAPLIVMAGDSICASWAPVWQATLNGSSTPPRIVNMGVAGAHTAIPSETPAYYLSDALPLYSASRAKNILLCEGISINDLAVFIGIDGNTGAVAASRALTSYYAYLDRAKADGWTVIACTLSPNTNGGQYDVARGIINTDIRANWAAHANVLCDLGAAPNFTTSADAAAAIGLGYSPDGLHLTSLGYTVSWDTVVLPVLQALLP